jgi:ferredoxin
MGCLEKKPSCFCDELGIDMTFSENCDAFIAFNDIDDSILMYIMNPKLETLFSEFNAAIMDSKEVESIEKEEHPNTSIESTLKIDAEETQLFEEIPWEIYSESCLECGICTYICPTCHCFEFQDVEDFGVTSRNRCWDSCMYPRFTLHASGHNPRSTQRERYRQRVLHKYLYVPKNCSVIACTGCGRCIRSCPGGVNIYKAVTDIIERIKSSRSEECV